MGAGDARLAGVVALIASVPMCLAASGCGRATPPSGRGTQGSRDDRPAPRPAGIAAQTAARTPAPPDYDGDDNPVPGTPLERDDRDGDEASSRLDRDDDFDGQTGSYFDGDDERALRMGHEAPLMQARAIASMMRSYYEDAASDRGAAVCSMVYSPLAMTLPADLAEAGPAFLQGVRGCPEVESRLLAQYPAEAVAQAARLERVQSRVAGERGLAVMSFHGMPPREIELRRRHGIWRLDALLDREMP